MQRICHADLGGTKVDEACRMDSPCSIQGGHMALSNGVLYFCKKEEERKKRKKRRKINPQGRECIIKSTS